MEIEVKKTLLILKSNPSSLKTAEAFLRNRDWEIVSTTNLKEALITILTKQPAFVLISMEYPHPKIATIPKILKQSFPLCFIAYAENSTKQTIELVQDSGLEYMLFPVVTGPAIERLVNKYYKDQLNKMPAESDGQRFSSGGVNDIPDFVRLKSSGHGQSTNDINVKSSYNSEEFRNKLFTMLGVDPNEKVEELTVLNSNENSEQSNQSIAGGDSVFAELSKLSGGNKPKPENESLKRPQVMGFDPKNSKSNFYSKKYDHENASESVIVQGTKEAIESSVEFGTGEVSENVDQASNVACIMIESTRFSGYLVAALGKDKKIDEEFIKMIQDRLVKFLKQNGEQLNSEESLNLKINKVPFEEWALAYADFLRKSVHNGEEIAMAFFPRSDMQGKWAKAKDEEMFMISLDEIKPDTPIEMNLYLYLPKNNKYCLYTPKHGRFSQTQKERLMKQRVTHLHAMKLDMEDFKRYRAQNFFNEKIDDFNQKKSESSTEDKNKKAS